MKEPWEVNLWKCERKYHDDPEKKHYINDPNSSHKIFHGRDMERDADNFLSFRPGPTLSPQKISTKALNTNVNQKIFNDKDKDGYPNILDNKMYKGDITLKKATKKIGAYLK